MNKQLKELLLELVEFAGALEKRGLSRYAEYVDNIVRTAYFDNLKSFEDRPEAQFFGGINPDYTGLNDGMATRFHQLATPCGAISLPSCSMGSEDPEECAQRILESIQEQCPQLAQNEAVMTQYFQDLAEWANNDYLEQRQGGPKAPASPQTTDPQYAQPQQAA